VTFVVERIKSTHAALGANIAEGFVVIEGFVVTEDSVRLFDKVSNVVGSIGSRGFALVTNFTG
jgi:hypothetical protein